MVERRQSSSRVLLDRTTLRVDGHSFYTLAAHLYLTPKEHICRAVEELSTAGFTAVLSPPANPGNVDLLDCLFTEAERHGLLVIVQTDPRMLEPSGFLLDHFKHRSGLHSYMLPMQGGSAGDLRLYLRERDRIRAGDLFHPIWTPYRQDVPFTRWLEVVDFHSVQQRIGGPIPRDPQEGASAQFDRIVRECARSTWGRPLFCHSLEVGMPDEAREAGLFDFDPAVRDRPSRSGQWYLYGQSIRDQPRWDWLGPDADLVRLRMYEVLAHRARGIVVDFYECLRGPSPFSGRDRFFELAVIAQEIHVLHDFFAEGQLVHSQLETGHPLLRAAMLHHGEDILIVIWRNCEGDEYWIDPEEVGRAEVTIGLSPEIEVGAWRVDFPSVRQLPLRRDRSGAARIDVGRIDLTAMLLLSRTDWRPREIAGKLRDRLPAALRFAMRGALVRSGKVQLIEKELSTQGIGTPKPHSLDECHALHLEADRLMNDGEYVDAWALVQRIHREVRWIINRQMLAVRRGAPVEKGSRLDLLRRSYYTLPQYYCEADGEKKVPQLDYT